MEEPTKPAKKVRLGFGVVLGLIALGLVVAVAAAVIINARNKTSNKKSRGFRKDFSIVWAENHTRISDDGNRLELTLDQESGKPRSILIFSCKWPHLDYDCKKVNEVLRIMAVFFSSSFFFCRLRVQVKGHVSVWKHQDGHQAGTRQLSRNCHCILCEHFSQIHTNFPQIL